MARSLFLLAIASLMGAVLNPLILAVSDTAPVVRLNSIDIVETVPLPEPVSEDEEPAEVLAPAAGVVEPEVTISVPRNYNVTINSGEVIATGLSYNDIYKTGKMIYGHNSWGLMGNIVSLGYGEIFTVTESGVTQNYQVMSVVIYEKNVEMGTLQRDGQGSYMRAVLTAIDKDTGAHYDLALLTCYGTAFGNGDASHRYVVFAKAV